MRKKFRAMHAADDERMGANELSAPTQAACARNNAPDVMRPRGSEKVCTRVQFQCTVSR